MFKKIALLLFATSSSYAMESRPNTPTGDNNVKQTTEEVKTTPNGDKNKTEDDADDLSVLNIDKTVQQLNSINISDNNKNKTSNTSDKKIFFYIPDEEINGFDKINDNAFKPKNNKINDKIAKSKNPNSINLTNDKKDVNLFAEDDLNTAVMYSGADDVKEFLNLFSDDEQFAKEKAYEDNWAKIEIRNQFFQSCQAFLQKIIKLHKITEQMMSNFCNTDAFYNCVKIDLEPLSVLEDVYNYNIKMNYISKADLNFLNGQMRHLSRLISARTKKIKRHWYNMAALQEQLHTSETEASQIYWDDYWSNYFLQNK